VLGAENKIKNMPIRNYNAKNKIKTHMPTHNYGTTALRTKNQELKRNLNEKIR